MSPLTLNAELKDALASLDGERIEQLLAWHLADNGAANVPSFLSHLYREGLITHVEYTRAQLLASVEVTEPTVIRPRQPRPAASDDTPHTQMRPIPRRAAPPPDDVPDTVVPDEQPRADAVPDEFPATLVLEESSRPDDGEDGFLDTVKMDMTPRPVNDDDFPRTVTLGEQRHAAEDFAPLTRRGTPEPATEATPAGAATPAPPGRTDTAPAPPAAPAGYTMLDSIGEGGMGEILIARDNDLGRTVAFKKIHAEVAEHGGMVERFFMEAQVTAQLQHPYIVPVYQMLQTEGELGYAMKLVAGKTLGQLCAEARKQLEEHGRLDDEHATATLLDHFLKVCDAIHYAHRKGVLHRDLKPANIMVGAYNEVYVMDWGIARLLDASAPGFGDVTEPLRDLRARGEEDRTQFGEAIGTPAYMSPEQARGELDRLDHRSDQYALGLILFELLTLERARVSREPDQLDRDAREGVVAPLKPFHASLAVDRPLAAIVAKATHAQPEQRYDSTRQFADDIRHYLHNEAVVALPDTLTQKLGRWVVRHRVATLNIAAYALLGCLALAGYGVYRQQQADIATEQRQIHVDHMLSAVSARAGAIDRRLLRLQGVLEGLAVSAAGLYAHGQAAAGTLYSDADFRQSASAPPDLAPSPAFDSGISLQWPVYALAPGVAMSEVEPTLRRLDALRHGLRQLVRAGASAPLTGQSGHAANDDRLPVHLLQFGFREGFVIGYPGHAGYPPGFDPRDRPWYTQAMQAGATRWLEPFSAGGGRDTMLSVATPVELESGESAGVAVLEMTLAGVQRGLLDTGGLPGIERLLLLDASGALLAVSARAEADDASAAIPGAGLRDAYRAEVLEDIERRRSGFLSFEQGDREMLLAYQRLDANGWYLLAEADARAVLALY